MNKQHTNINDLPIILTVKEIQEILCIKRAKAYDVMNSTGFPTIQIGRAKRVHRDKFIKWLEDVEHVA